VVEHRSFTRAARVLGQPKSTVSRKIAELEEQLGVRLLQRTTRAVKATDLGEAYYERCTRIVAEAAEANAAVASAGAAPQGLLRLTAPVTFGATFLGEVVTHFLATYPGASVETVLTDRRVDLVGEGFDLAIRIGSRVQESSFFVRRLGPTRLVLAASPAYLARRGEPRAPGELREHDCLLYGELPQAASWVFAGPEGPVTVPVAGRLVANNAALVRSAALAGLGVARLPFFQAAPEIEAGRLRAVLPTWSPAVASVFAVYPNNRHLSPKVRAFLDCLVARLTAPWEPDARG
jgi:DNA-binding transcriptional LysR family regulator